MSEESYFPKDKDEMYYCVREGFSFTGAKTEGFCKNLQVESRMFKGKAIVDGWFNINLILGDVITLKADPKYALKKVKLNLWLVPFFI